MGLSHSKIRPYGYAVPLNEPDIFYREGGKGRRRLRRRFFLCHYTEKMPVYGISQSGACSHSPTAAVRVPRVAGRRAGHGLVLEVLGHARRAPLAPEAALLPPPKGRRRPERLRAVEPHGARLEPRAHALAPRGVGGHDGVAEAVGRVW